jgi:acetyl-CoA carboxylase biotin carboxylase subunit
VLDRWSLDELKLMSWNQMLDECIIEGITTTLPFHKRILANTFFRRGEIYTNFIQRRMVAEIEAL